MAQLKTRPTNTSVEDSLDAVEDEAHRADRADRGALSELGASIAQLRATHPTGAQAS